MKKIHISKNNNEKQGKNILVKIVNKKKKIYISRDSK